MTFTKERLEQFIKNPLEHGLTRSEQMEMARQMLVGLEQEPVYQVQHGDQWRDLNKAQYDDHVNLGAEGLRILYAAPHLPQPAVVDDASREDFEAWARDAGFNEDWYFFTNVHPNHYDDDHINDMWAAWSACRAAMLQGAEPASQPDELPMDYKQGHKDGLEWAARLAEANHPQTGDWLYDDPLELAKAIRKGPDMPVEPMQKLTFREALAAIRNLGPIDAEKIQAERDALNEPNVPDGYALVPVEPTEKMVIEGFESVPHPLFQPADWDKYQTMSGCEQAAHRAKLCWAAMIKAAPKP